MKKLISSNSSFIQFVFLLSFTSSQAGIFGPSISTPSGLSPTSAIGTRELISAHKVIKDKLVTVNCFGNPCQPDGPGMAKAVDGDFKTATGPITFLSIDLGDVYVIDSSFINFAHSEKYNIATSLYWNGTLPPTYDLNQGYGIFPDSVAKNQSFHPILWKEKDQQKGLEDGWKINPTVGRFLWYYFRQESNTEVANINEVQVFGHKYIPHPGDRVELNRSAWTSYGSSCQNCGEGWTGEGMYDWLLGPHEMLGKAGDWVVISLNDNSHFDRVSVVFSAAAKVDFYASKDSTNWGSPLATIATAGVDSITLSLPPQDVRFLKFVNQGEPNGNWWHIFDVMLWSPLDPKTISIQGTKLNSNKIFLSPNSRPNFLVNGRKPKIVHTFVHPN